MLVETTKMINYQTPLINELINTKYLFEKSDILESNDQKILFH